MFLNVLLALILVGIWAYTKYFGPKIDDAIPDPGRFDSPRNEEASPVPIFYGTVRIKGPIVIMARNYRAIPRTQIVNGDTIVIGYNYRLFMQFLLGTPGFREDADVQSAVRKFWIGERLVWSGSLSDPSKYVYIQKETLFGGANEGGGVEGFLNYLPGSLSQVNNDFQKDGLSVCEANNDVAYRGYAVVTLCSAGFAQDDEHDFGLEGGHGPDGHVFTGTVLHNSNLVNRGWKLGESSSLEGYSWEVQAKTTYTSLGATLGMIGLDANPISILYDILTNSWNRGGLASSKIDTTSFLAAGLALQSEGHGMSLLISSQMEAREAAQLVLQQIAAIMYEDASTGKLKLRLVRDDYTPSALLLLDPSNVVEILSYASGNWNETYNQIRVTYTDRVRNYTDAVAIAQDQANFYTSGSSRLRTRNVSYPGCMTRQLADKLAARDLKAVSIPLAKLRIAVNRDAYTLRPGDLFRLSWPEFDGMTDVVFRVFRYDLGKLGEEKIILDCIQDQFAFDHKVFRIPPIKARPYIPPYASNERIVEESARWMNLRAWQAGRVVDPDVPRAYHLAIPRGTSVAHTAEIMLDGRKFAQDIEPQAFPGYAEVETDYSRALEPYDTSTGLRITGVVGWSPASADATDIASKGKNLIRVGHEYMAFESVTDLGGGVYRLNNVWRGLMDTVPTTHTAGERVWFVANETGLVVSRVGRVSWQPGGSVPTVRQAVHADGRTVRPFSRLSTTTAADSIITPVQIPVDVDDDEMNESHDLYPSEVGSRVTLAYPPANITVNGSKTPAQLEEGGVDVVWVRRNRLQDVLLRGDHADEDPEAGTLFAVVGKKSSDTSPSIAQFGGTVDYTYTELDAVLLGNVGYGSLDVGVQSFTPVLLYTIPSTGTKVYQNYSCWQVPYITIEAPHWRNLLLDGRFDDSIDDPVWLTKGWRTIAGTPIIGSSGGLGGSGYYIHTTTASSPATVRQKFSIDGFNPGNLTATCHFYHHNFNGDAGDTATITLEALDGGDGVVATVNTTETPSTSEWRRGWIAVTVPTTATQLRVTIAMTGVGDSTPDSAVTEVIVRLGQVASVAGNQQLLANQDFESGTTSWTVGSGSFAASTTAPIYVATQYIHATGSGSGELYQEVNLPGGFEANAVALLECARMDAASSDQGNVILEARNGGGTVLATTSTGMEHITTGTWARRRLSLSIPVGATKLRLRFATTDHGALDDCDLRIYKELDSTIEDEYRFDIPASQPVPADLDYFDRAYPDIDIPDLAFWAGSFQGVLGTEPALEPSDDVADNPPTDNEKFIGAYDATTNGAVITRGWNFTLNAGCGLIANHADFGAFRFEDSFTFFFHPKIAEWQTGTWSWCGRFGTYGWYVNIDSGTVTFVIVGIDGTKTCYGGLDMRDKAIHPFAIVYDADAQEMRVVDEAGVSTVATDTGLGEFDEDNAVFSFGAVPGSGGTTPQDCQIGRVYAWNSAIATADLQSMITIGGAPNSTINAVRVGTMLCPVGEDSDGIVASRFAVTQNAFIYNSSKLLDEDNGLGFPIVGDIGNNITAAQNDPRQNSTDWHTTGTVTTEWSVGPEGNLAGIRVQGTNAQGNQLWNVATSASPNICVMWFARGDSAHSARLTLLNSSGVSKGTYDYAVTTKWQMFSHVFTTWDASTATCRLMWSGSNTGSSQYIEMAGPFFVLNTTEPPVCILLDAECGYTDIQMSVGSLSSSFNVEGEIQVEGVASLGTPGDGLMICQLTNGSNDNDRKDLYIDESGKLKLDHADGSGTVVTSATAAQSTWNSAWSVRGRWNRAGLLDASSKYAGCIYGDELTDPSGYGRTSTFTPSTTGPSQMGIALGDIGDPFNFILRRLVIRTREERLL